jgi:glycosyltransferase involved in cell wall biosynthesis
MLCSTNDLCEVSIVVIGKNVSEYLEESLPPIITQADKSPREISITFVDDGSTDDTIRTLNEIQDKFCSFGFETITVIRNNFSTGPANARNIGAQRTRPKYYIFLDSDDIIEENHLDNLIDFAVSNNIGIGWGRNVEFGTVGYSAQPVHNNLPILLKSKEFLPAGPSNNMIVAQEAFNEAGGFSTNFNRPGSEDTALCFKVQLLGYKASQCSNAVVLYRQPSTIQKAFRQQFSYGYSSVTLVNMFKEVGMPVQPWPSGLVKLILSALSLPLAILPKHRLRVVGRFGRRLGIAIGAMRHRLITL